MSVVVPVWSSIVQVGASGIIVLIIDPSFLLFLSFVQVGGYC